MSKASSLRALTSLPRTLAPVLRTLTLVLRTMDATPACVYPALQIEWCFPLRNTRHCPHKKENSAMTAATPATTLK